MAKILVKCDPHHTIESYLNRFRPMDKKDVLYGSSILNLNHYESKLHGLADLAAEVTRREAGDADVRGVGEADALEIVPKSRSKRVTLLKSPSFMAFCAANSMFMFGMFSPFVFIIRLGLYRVSQHKFSFVPYTFVKCSEKNC